MKAHITVMIASLTFLMCGCMSATIVGTGKRYEGLTSHSTTVDQVRKSLGKPSWSQVYAPPIPINTSSDQGPKAALCEVYTRRGPYAEPIRGEAYAMIGALTLGIGDIISIPFAIRDRTELNKRNYSLTFWFDDSGFVVSCFRGDFTIQPPAEDIWGKEPQATPAERH